MSELPVSLAERVWLAAPLAAVQLDESSRGRYLAHAERLVQRINWEAARGFALTDRVIESIAAHAALLVAGFEPRTEPFRDVTSVIVHAGTIVTHETVPGPTRGVVSDSPRYLAGQAGHGRGPIVLDWRTAQHEVANPDGGTNVIYHEFAHKLDMRDDIVDGTPRLEHRGDLQRWVEVCTEAYDALRAGVDRRPLQPYGATNPAEFFAVATEAFFDVPIVLERHEPDLYGVMRDFYKQDPAERARRAERP